MLAALGSRQLTVFAPRSPRRRRGGLEPRAAALRVAGVTVAAGPILDRRSAASGSTTARRWPWLTATRTPGASVRTDVWVGRMPTVAVISTRALPHLVGAVPRVPRGTGPPSRGRHRVGKGLGGWSAPTYPTRSSDACEDRRHRGHRCSAARDRPQRGRGRGETTVPTVVFPGPPSPRLVAGTAFGAAGPDGAIEVPRGTLSNTCSFRHGGRTDGRPSRLPRPARPATTRARGAGTSGDVIAAEPRRPAERHHHAPAGAQHPSARARDTSPATASSPGRQKHRRVRVDRFRASA
ncbi:hypothetical protein FTX61_07565 [Nitriliruptoraceae bacterium ZYF776]|nr:hypothetical protein [Profundirhabdus halotolerans]